jgi:hypothetical protein
VLANKDIPRDPLQNLEYRAELARWLNADEKKRTARQASFQSLCEKDVLCFFNSVLWLLEPRDEDGKGHSSKIPFCSWIHQDAALEKLQADLGRKDVVISKSRAEGASWLVLMLFLHRWLYRKNSLFGVVSKNENSAASFEDADSLLFKFNWQLEQMPLWMRPRSWRPIPSENTISNYDNGSAISAYACTEDAGVGGRKLALMFDELSRWGSGKDYVAWVSNQAVSPCRIAVSTPFGMENQYADLVHDDDSDILKLRLSWKDNPTKNRGLYRVVDGKAILVDSENSWPGDYAVEVYNVLPKLVRKGYNVEQGVRSKWYDGQCLRSGATPHSIAQELDESFTGHTTPYFSEFLLKRLRVETVRPPYKRGTLSYDPEILKPTWREDENGDLLLWTIPLRDGTPPFGKYALGCDISQGTGGSYSSLSVCCVFDATTGEQVAEFTTRNMRPDKFADWTIALAKWFHDGKINFEAPGPGIQFMNQVIYRGYGNVYLRRVKEVMATKVTKKIGLYVQADDKVQLFGGGGSGHEGFYGAVIDGKAVIRSDALVTECGEYLYKMRNGKLIVVHSSDGSSSPGTKKKGSAAMVASEGKDHGDRVVAAAIAWMTTQEVGKLDENRVDDSAKEAPSNTLAARVREAEEKDKELVLANYLDFD